MDSSGFDYESLQNAREYARIQDEINSGLEGYIDGIKKVKTLSKDLQTIDKNINELKEKTNSLTGEELKMNLASIHLLERKKGFIEKEVKYTKEILKTAKKWDMLGGSILASTVKTAASLEKIPSMIGNITNKFKDLFEMDKAIRQAGLEMGLINKQSDVFRKNIESAASNTISFGVGIKELAEMQSQYSQSIGRNVSMGQKDLEALAEIAKGTSLGAEATAQMASDFEAQGISALRTKDYIQEAVDNSSALGLNTSKVMSNLSQNVKMLNKYRFKDGVKGLVKMSELSTKLGVSMEFASGFADKLWDVEGAVETSAQLQVMGGAFARLADPFKLMYMARNDMAGLTEELGKAAAESVNFNSKTGEFEIAAMEMHKLKIIAQQTGLSYDELATAGKNAAKFAKLKTQIPFQLTKDAKEFIENTAQFDENGKAYIKIDGEKKFLNQLGASGKQLIEQQVEEKKSLKKRAEEAQSFDESLTNLINMVKIYMMPIVEGLTGVLKPFVDDLMGDKGTAFKAELKSLRTTLGNWISTAATWFKAIGEVAVALGPEGIFYTWLGAKGLLMAFDAAKWLANGLALSKGFLIGTKGFGSGASSDIGGSRTQKGSPKNKKMMRGIKGGGIASLLGMGVDVANSAGAFGEEGSQGSKYASVGASALEYGGMGAMIGSMIAPGIGTAIGGAIGGLGGAIKGAFDEGLIGGGDTQSMDDGIIKFNKNDKFTKVDDSTMVAGTNKNGNKDLAQVLKYGMLAANPLGSLMGGLMGGVFGGSNNATSAGTPNKIEFGELVISGEIKINIPGGTQIATELMKSQEFKTSITRVVTSQLEKNMNGGKNKG
jgi:hypothetical protein